MTKKWWPALASLMACLLLWGAVASQAADKDGKSLEDKGKKTVSAATIDFAAELGLDFPSLKGLGLRIERAEVAPDPVGLAGAALELSVAEKTSGKKAKVKSEDLLKKAVHMAHRRNRPDELKAMALLVHDSKLSKELSQQAAKAQKELDDRKNGEKSRGIEGRLFVTNHTGYYIKVYVDSRDVGTVNPYSTATMWVGASPFQDTVLYGYAPGTSLTWGSRRVSERVQTYTWHLH
jgi:hypothetical protein